MQKTLLSTAIIGLLLSTTSVFAVESANHEMNTAAQAPAPAANPEMAAKPDTQAREKFQALDKNHDGKIDKKEAKADKDLNKSFKKIAKKGKLDESGYINWQQAQRPRG